MSAPRRPRKRTGNVWPSLAILFGVTSIALHAGRATWYDVLFFVLGQITLVIGVRGAVEAGRDGHRDD